MLVAEVVVDVVEIVPVLLVVVVAVVEVVPLNLWRDPKVKIWTGIQKRY